MGRAVGRAVPGGGRHEVRPCPGAIHRALSGTIREGMCSFSVTPRCLAQLSSAVKVSPKEIPGPILMLSFHVSDNLPANPPSCPFLCIIYLEAKDLRSTTGLVVQRQGQFQGFSRPDVAIFFQYCRLVGCVCVCVCVGFPSPTSNSRTPAGCLRIQLNSDTVYLGTASAPTHQGLSPTGPPSMSHASRKSRWLPVFLTDRLQIEVPMPLSLGLTLTG